MRRDKRSQPRMTLRDQFAAIALPVVMTHDDWRGESNPESKVVTDDEMARAAYEMADAMMKARRGRP
jgi:hypothetical protein